MKSEEWDPAIWIQKAYYYDSYKQKSCGIYSRTTLDHNFF